MVSNLFNLLRKISEVIAGHSEYHLVLQKIVTLLAENLYVDVCSIYEYSEETNELVLIATHGLNHEAINNIKIKSGTGITGKSFAAKQPINVGNTKDNPDFLYFKGIGEEEFLSFLAIPLTIGGHCLGELTFQRKKQEPFEDIVIDMAKSLSTQLANLILNSKGSQTSRGCQSQ